MEGIYVKCNEDVLIHHGIKGQKWGVRRYQNSDGSLTTAGKSRYGVKGEHKKTRYFKKDDNGNITEVSKRQYRKGLKAEARRKSQSTKDYANDLIKKAESGTDDIVEATARYKAVADLLEQRGRIERQVAQNIPKQKTKTEKFLSNLDNISKAANSISNIYSSYNKVFGKNEPSEMEKINLESARINLENTKLNRRKTELMVTKLNHDYQKSLADEAWQNRIKKAKRSTIFRTQRIDDESLKRWTERKKTENDFLDAVFSQYDKVK